MFKNKPFRDYWRSRTAAEKQALAKAVGSRYLYLAHIAGGQRRPSVRLARKIAAASNGALTVDVLRPDIFLDPPTLPPAELSPAA